tara:strand:+ start:52 stop:450 length:399 start_codon:yes stop_codon:yes gene_type:complete
VKLLAKLIVTLLSLFCLISIIGFIFNFSVVFPFSISEGIHDVPEHRLQAVRLATMATFAYFGLRFIFYQTTKLYPIQFMGIFLFFLSTIGTVCLYKYQSELSEYSLSIFYLLTSIVLYQAGKPAFRNYFRRK